MRTMLIGGTAILATVLSAILLAGSFTRSQRLCENNDNSAGAISPCEGPPETEIKIKPGRQISASPDTLIFKRVIANGLPVQVIAQISDDNIVLSPLQLCLGGNGRWEVWLTLEDGQSQGKIGAFWASGCVGGNSTGLGKPLGEKTTENDVDNIPPQQLIVLTPIIIKVDNEVYAKTKSTSQSYIKNISSSISEVATGMEWGTNEVKIRGRKPGVTTISFLDVNNNTLYQIEVTVKEGLKDGDGEAKPKPTPEQADNTYPCLVGEWEAFSLIDIGRFKWTGGTGFRVTFKADGTQIVDYATMSPLVNGGESFTYKGTSISKITITDGIAEIESIENPGGVTEHVVTYNDKFSHPVKSLGPGGLGTASDSGFVCTGEVLEYKTSTALDRHPKFTVKLRRLEN